MSIEEFSFRVSVLLSLLLTLPSVSVHAQDAVKRDHRELHRLHADPKAYIGALEDPKRDEYQKPHEVLTALGLRAGEVIADIGAGSGYFTFHLAHHVGAKGKVYAVDVSPEMIRHVNRRVRDLKATNVVSLLADADDPLLPERSIDRFFVCNVWHHIESPAKYLAAMKRSLKPGGEVVMIDFHKKIFRSVRRHR